MNPGPQIARCLAAMVLAIIAWAAPSAAGAHEGHAHSGHHRAAITRAAAITVMPADAERLIRSQAPIAIAAVDTSASGIRSDDPERPDGRGPHGTCCCGAACCAPGILPGSMTLLGSAPGRRVLRPHDAPDRSGIGPEALNEPPRPPA